MGDLKHTGSGDKIKFLYECFLCGRDFQFGPHVYDGKHIGPWNIQVCRGCYQGNWDGIVIEGRPKLVEHLKSLGIEIKRNARGWVDWPV